MLCCTALPATASRNYSVCRTTQLGSFSGAKTIPRQPVVEDVTLAARSAEHRLQSSDQNVQSSNTSTPAYLRRLIQDQQLGHNLRSAPRRRVNRPVHDDDICKARLPMVSSGCMELATENCSQQLQFLSLGYGDIPFLPGFLSFLCSLTRCLAPAPLKLRQWRYSNLFLLLLLLLLLFYDYLRHTDPKDSLILTLLFDEYSTCIMRSH